jgi:hypothetical protein
MQEPEIQDNAQEQSTSKFTKAKQKIRRSIIKLYVEHQEKSWQNKETLVINFLAYAYLFL